MNPSKPWDCRGQGLIECLVTLPFLTLALVGILSLTYRAGLFYLADQQLHEALICLDDDSSSTCENQLHTSLGRLVLFKIPFKTSLRLSGQLAQGIVEVRLSPVLRIEKSLTFPLSARRQ